MLGTMMTAEPHILGHHPHSPPVTSNTSFSTSRSLDPRRLPTHPHKDLDMILSKESAKLFSRLRAIMMSPVRLPAYAAPVC